MKKIDNYALPEMISFQNNEIVKFWAFEFIFDQYYFKNHTGNDTSVCFQYWYSVFCLGTETYTDFGILWDALEYLYELSWPLEIPNI